MTQIHLSPRWRGLTGHACGLPQPPLLGTLRIDAAAPDDAARLHEAMLHLCGAPDREAPRDALGDPALTLAHMLAFWTGEVQRHARLAVVPQYRVAPTPGEAGAGVERSFELMLPHTDARATAATLTRLCRIADELLASPADATDAPDAATATSLAEGFEAFQLELRRRAAPGFNQNHLLLAAHRLQMPVAPVGGGVFRLGSGARARLVQSTITDRTPALGMNLAQDKWLTTRLLHTIGVPATRNERAASADAAVAIARRWGWPVVIKPADQDQGRGVAARLASEAALCQAWEAAHAVSPRVLIERHVEGFGHRFTLHDGELIAVLRRIPGGVTGDGQHSIAELLQLQRQSGAVRRSLNLGRVSLDEEARALLAEEGLTPDQVPAAGRFVLLRRRDNISVGGRIEHLDPATVHPDNLRAARRAAQALHLDLAGVDFISRDIGRSWRDNGAAICEVNARPQFGPGALGSNYDRVLQRLLGADTRIPVHLVLCPDPTAAALLDLLRRLRRSLGLQALACRRGVWVDGEPHAGRQRHGHAAARSALANREVQSLLFAMAPSEIVATGLPIDRVDAVHIAPGPWPEAESALRATALTWCACADQRELV